MLKPPTSYFSFFLRWIPFEGNEIIMWLVRREIDEFVCGGEGEGEILMISI